MEIIFLNSVLRKLNFYEESIYFISYQIFCSQNVFFKTNVNETSVEFILTVPLYLNFLQKSYLKLVNNCWFTVQNIVIIHTRK